MSAFQETFDVVKRRPWEERYFARVEFGRGWRSHYVVAVVHSTYEDAIGTDGYRRRDVGVILPIKFVRKYRAVVLAKSINLLLSRWKSWELLDG